MKEIQQDTPPSSINGDEIGSMDDEGYYFEEIEEIQLDDEDMDVQDEDDIAEENEEDLSCMTFEGHTASAFCCDFHPSGKYAVTGGEDDKAFVWSVESGEIVTTLTGHQDSIIFAGFSFDGVYLATIDMGGSIKVWKCEFENSQQSWTNVFELETVDLSWGLWHFGARVLICGGDTGQIYVIKIPSGETKILNGHNVKCECAKIFPDGVRLAAGYDDGSVKIWDLKTSLTLHQIPATVHQTRVTAIDTHPENNLMISIGSDGKVVLTTSNNGKVVGQFETEKDLEVVAFSPDPQLDFFALGSLNGSVSIWDTAKQMMRHQCAKSSDDVDAGVTKMIWIKDQLVTACLDGSIKTYDARSGTKSCTLTGHLAGILDISYNSNDNLLLCASDCGLAKLFKYPVNT